MQETDLRSVVFGRDPAIDVLTSVIKMSCADLGRTDKPIGSLLFSDPTGVGRTGVAKQLAFILGIELARFDMSEYMECHAVSRLIDAPPGYVGFDQGGLLTEVVIKKPHCTLLLDEIEKAHPDIFNILLQVADHGMLTDNNDHEVDSRDMITIMMTNAGAETMNKVAIGFTTACERGDEIADIKHMFTPELRDRLNATINFRSLDEKVIMRAVGRFLMQLEEQLHGEKVDTVFTEKLRRFLAKKGLDPLMDVRPVQRSIQDLIRKVLANELLFDRLVNDGKAVVGLDDADTMKPKFSENGTPLVSAQEEAGI